MKLCGKGQAMLNSLYEDNHLLIVFKPHGTLTQPDGIATNSSLEEQVKQFIKYRDNKPCNVFARPIHRLDRLASGLVIFAKTSKALTRMQEKMRQHDINKYYLALIEHAPNPSEGPLSHYHRHGNFRAYISNEPYSQSKPVSLSYKVKAPYRNYMCIEVQLHTGRYHQIRAQFAHIGLPLIGDKKYGSSLVWKPDAIALCHYRCQFSHPVTGKQVDVLCQPNWQN